MDGRSLPLGPLLRDTACRVATTVFGQHQQRLLVDSGLGMPGARPLLADATSLPEILFPLLWVPSSIPCTISLSLPPHTAFLPEVARAAPQCHTQNFHPLFSQKFYSGTNATSNLFCLGPSRKRKLGKGGVGEGKSEFQPSGLALMTGHHGYHGAAQKSSLLSCTPTHGFMACCNFPSNHLRSCLVWSTLFPVCALVSQSDQGSK